MNEKELKELKDNLLFVLKTYKDSAKIYLNENPNNFYVSEIANKTFDFIKKGENQILEKQTFHKLKEMINNKQTHTLQDFGQVGSLNAKYMKSVLNGVENNNINHGKVSIEREILQLKLNIITDLNEIINGNQRYKI